MGVARFLLCMAIVLLKGVNFTAPQDTTQLGIMKRESILSFLNGDYLPLFSRDVSNFRSLGISKAGKGAP